VFYADVHAAPFVFAGRACIMGFFHDTTQRKKVEEDLNKKMTELERFNKLTVGRELKMVELKNRIKELEGKLGAHGAAT
jgi:hypothetical protein